MGVFNCGYAERSLSSSKDFTFYFGKEPCDNNTISEVTVFMKPIDESNTFYPGCAFFNPASDNVIEVN